MNNETQSAKKPYDPTMSFSVFGSWFETMGIIKKSYGTDEAYRFFEAIANYSMYHEAPDFSDSPLQMLWPMTEREIDISLKRRGANFSSEETEERRRLVIAVYSENPSLSMREIEERTGVSKSAVSRILQKWRGEGQEGEEQERVQEREGEEDTMGLGRDGTVGQSRNIDPWENLSDEERKEVSLLDRIQTRIASADWKQLEILQNQIDMSRNTPMDKINSYRVDRVRSRWKASYLAWIESIANESVNLILDKYLSTHTETATEKQWGDRYGRIISGWDNEKQEPIILYSATGGFPQGTQHNIANIPVDYYRAKGNAAEVEEETAWFDDLLDEDKAILGNSNELPF